MRRPLLSVLMLVAAAGAARADFLDDVRRTFQKDIPRVFEHDIPKAFGAEPKKPEPSPRDAAKPAVPPAKAKPR